jgi:putative hemolysin
MESLFILRSQLVLTRTGHKGAVLALMVGALVALAGCGPMSSSQSSLSMPAAPPQAAISFCNSAAANCTPEQSFSVGMVRDLDVVVNWTNLPEGTHAQKVSFLLPNGDFYTAYEKSFEVAAGSNGTLTTIQALPVAGTWISQRRLTGTWSVTVELDGQPMGTGTFEFMP